MKAALKLLVTYLVISITAWQPVPIYADAMQDILDKKTDVERTLQEIEKYAALNGGKKVPDSALENEIGRLETHLKQMDQRLESLPPCKSAPTAPSAAAAIAGLKGCIVTPPGLPEAKKKQDDLEQEIRNLKKRIDYVTQVKGIADYLLTMKLFSASLGLAIEFIPSGVSSYPAGPIFDFIKVMISAGDSSMGFTQPGAVKNWKGREEYHRYLDENKDEINKEMSKRAAEKGMVDPKTGKAKISPYEAMIMGNDFTSKIAKRELDAKWKRFNDAKKEFDEAKKKAEDLEKERQEQEKKNRYFEGLIRRLEDLFRDSKWLHDPKQFEKMRSEIKVSVFDDKSGTLLTTATVKAAPSAGSARTAGNPYEFEGVTAGSYSFTAEAPGYVKETSALEVTTCQKYAVVIRLKKKPIIKVADIKDDEGHFLDDINVDVTALTAGASSPGSQNYRRVPVSFIVDPGAFTVTGTDPGDTYETTSANVNVEAGGEAEVHLVMPKKGASLVVEVWDSISNLRIDPPPGANEPSVQLEPLESQPPPLRQPYKGKGEIPFGRIAPGRYKYTARFCGWEEQTGEFTITPDEFKSKRALRKISLKPTKLDTFTGNVFEHGQSEHIDGFKVSLIGLGPRKGYRYDTEEGKDPDPNVAGLHSGAFVIKGPIYSGRYKLQITRKCFQPLIIDDWWVFCGIEPNANSTFSPQNFQLHPTAEFDRARQEVRSLMTKMTEQRKNAADASDQIAGARREMQDASDLAGALVQELEAAKQLHPNLSQQCTDSDTLVSELNAACKVVADAATKIATFADTTKTSAGSACQISDEAQKATDPSKASEDGDKSKQLAAQAKKAAEEAAKIAQNAHASYETAAQKQGDLSQLEQNVNDLRKAFSASSGKLEDLRKRLESAEQATKSLAQADAATAEASRLLASIRQLLQGCADDHPGKPLLENAEQASDGVVAEGKRAADEHGLLKGLVSGAEGATKEADALGKELESLLKTCARVQESGSLVADAKASLEKIDALSLAAQNSIKVADDCAAKAIAAADVTVPDLGPFNDLKAMKQAADQAGMVLLPTAIDVKPPDGVKRIFAGQDPKPNTKSKRGKPLKIYIYQALAQKSAEPAATATAAPSAVAVASPKTATDDNEYVVVPSVANADSIDYMRTILQQAGFKSAFHARKPQSKADENKFAGQDPVGKIKKSDMEQRHNLVVVYINQKWESPESAQATPTEQQTQTGEMPNLIGLTLDQAVGRLTGNMSIGGDEIGSKPPTPEKALTIYAQTPAAGEKVSTDKNVVVTVKRYGSAKAAEETPASSSETPSSGASAGFAGYEGNWSLPGTTSTIKIYRSGNGYAADGLAVGDPNSTKEVTLTGVEESGRLVFHETVPGGIKWTYVFTPNGDNLLADSSWVSSGGGAAMPQVILQRQK